MNHDPDNETRDRAADRVAAWLDQLVVLLTQPGGPAGMAPGQSPAAGIDAAYEDAGGLLARERNELARARRANRRTTTTATSKAA
jgi:hypothetical protein